MTSNASSEMPRLLRRKLLRRLVLFGNYWCKQGIYLLLAWIWYLYTFHLRREGNTFDVHRLQRSRRLILEQRISTDTSSRIILIRVKSWGTTHYIWKVFCSSSSLYPVPTHPLYRRASRPRSLKSNVRLGGYGRGQEHLKLDEAVTGY